jgi:hypothetical protein
MKVLLLGLLAGLATAKWAAPGDCPQSKQVTCVDDVRAGYEPCKKAAEAGGSDMIADLTCMKYYNKMRSDCWPCICDIAKMDKIPIKGC